MALARPSGSFVRHLRANSLKANEQRRYHREREQGGEHVKRSEMKTEKKENETTESTELDHHLHKKGKRRGGHPPAARA